ncbi:glycerophosphoryl diester phosphodiesterase [Bacillus sp. OV322]|uniref:glycerophosphodiester phosphodiesterase n=1 Tax=Bacillus sp. OV322 TaxID=1882764 RepID=UPI0008E5EBDA|nr:glycerophosphodiester phosphodiesterase [Bacillus sp. OV322]SFC30193.1 glycerophosphoryl diester phosphodiesterase [Bacillus sp. OV322]
MKNVCIFAHRGSKGTHPENTLSAFEAALRSGADGIELDVHLTKDGKLAVIHDETLERTTTLSGYVADYTAEELKMGDAGIKFSPSFKNEKIPLLEEVFQWAKDTSLIINVELKNDKLPYAGLEKKVIELIRGYSYEKRIILSSFNHKSIGIAQKIAPEIESALLFEKFPVNFEELLKANQGAAFHPALAGFTKEHALKAKALGCKVRPYTANSECDIIHILELGVEGLFTDFPARAIELAYEFQESKK